MTPRNGLPRQTGCTILGILAMAKDGTYCEWDSYKRAMSMAHLSRQTGGSWQRRESVFTYRLVDTPGRDYPGELMEWAERVQS